MNNRYDEEFFNDLDKTTDLLKAFKPRISANIESVTDIDNNQNIEVSNNEDKSANNQGMPIIEELKEIYGDTNEDVASVEEIKQTDIPRSDIGAIIKKMEMTLLRQKKDEEVKSELKAKTPKKVVKKRLIFNKIELAFCLISIIFIVGCIAYLVQS